MAAVLVGGAPAQAQNLAPEVAHLFSRNRNVAVADRPHPEYEPRGGRIGSFRLLPELEAGVRFEDNVFATATAEKSDTAAVIAPKVRLVSDWRKHELSLSARGEFARHEALAEEDYSVGSVLLAGRLDVLRSTKLLAGAQWSKAEEERTSPQAQAFDRDRVRYTSANSYAGATHTMNRVRFTGRIDATRYDFRDVAERSGGLIDQDFRDHDVKATRLRVDYALSPAAAVFVQGVYNDRRYRTNSGRDSHGAELLAGADLEWGLLRGDLAVGYLSQDYEQFEDLQGVGASAKLQWFPTQLTTVTASASRVVEDAPQAVGGYLSTSQGLRVDHELLRNLLLAAEASRTSDDYADLSRKVDQVQATASAVWLFNRRVGLRAWVTHTHQTSSGAFPAPEFDATSLYVGTLLRY